MEKYDVKQLVEKIYELDVKVYEATGSTMGKVFPAGKDLSVKKMLKHLDEDKRHFIRDETILIGNMISTIKDSSVASECRKELEELNEMLEQYNPTKQLPDSFISDISEMKSIFKGGKNKILCIGRQYGSGGHEVGLRLSTKLNMSYYDNEIIKMACEHIGKDFSSVDASQADSKKGWLNKTPFSLRKFSGNDELFFAQSQMIEEMAKKGDCIFLGRCADVVLEHADIPHVSVFIGAPFEQRVKHDMVCTGVGYDETAEKVRAMDRVRKAYYNYYTGRRWGHSENYDMCLNTACYGIDGTVEVIEKMFKLFD